MKVKHVLHVFGSFGEGYFPKARATRPNGPPKGTAHSRQRGLCGSLVKTDRKRCSMLAPRVR
jgi:hypothetical protein